MPEHYSMLTLGERNRGGLCYAMGREQAMGASALYGHAPTRVSWELSIGVLRYHYDA